MTARDQLLEAVKTKLSGDTALMALITGIYDLASVPQGKKFPYIVIGNMTESDFSALSNIGYDDTFYLHIWSMNKGSKECNTILSNLNRLLNKQPLTLATQHHVGTWYDFSDFKPDPGENGIFHMPVRYKMKAQEH